MEAGNVIQHKKTKTKAVVQGEATIMGKEVGLWILDQFGGRWVLQYNWCDNWQVIEA